MSDINHHIKRTPNNWRYLEEFGLMVAGKDGVVTVAGIREQLSTINSERCQGERAICVFRIGAVLPLYNALRARRVSS